MDGRKTDQMFAALEKIPSKFQGLTFIQALKTISKAYSTCQPHVAGEIPQFMEQLKTGPGMSVERGLVVFKL